MLLNRVAGAPISWGVCEVPGWGHQLSASRVLTEMAESGLVATEFGPDGFLPADRASVLRAHGLAAVGGFVPLVLHDPNQTVVASIDAVLDDFLAAGANVLVLSADTGLTGYDQHEALDDAAWRTLLNNLDRIRELAGERGVRATLHPHIGTVVRGPDEVARVLDGSSMPLCLDTGHLMIGGTDPVRLARDVPDRIEHTHLKDVAAGLADAVRNGQQRYSAAVAAGLYRPLGHGDIDLASIITALEGAGYTGWYVLEQDTVLAEEPPAGQGPVLDVRESLRFIEGVSQ